MFIAKGVTLPGGGRAKDVVKGGPHPILIPLIIAPVSLVLMSTSTAGKRCALGHDWSIETEVVEVFDGCTRQGRGISHENVSWR